MLGRMTPTCRTPSDTKAPLALGKSAREKTSLGSWETPLRSAPRIGKKCSGALKNTSHLGQKDARDKRARGKHPSYWTNILVGKDGVLTGQSMKVTMYGWFKRRVAEVAAED